MLRSKDKSNSNRVRRNNLKQQILVTVKDDLYKKLVWGCQF